MIYYLKKVILPLPLSRDYYTYINIISAKLKKRYYQCKNKCHVGQTFYLKPCSTVVSSRMKIVQLEGKLLKMWDVRKVRQQNVLRGDEML